MTERVTVFGYEEPPIQKARTGFDAKTGESILMPKVPGASMRLDHGSGTPTIVAIHAAGTDGNEVEATISVGEMADLGAALRSGSVMEGAGVALDRREDGGAVLVVNNGDKRGAIRLPVAVALSLAESLLCHLPVSAT